MKNLLRLLLLMTTLLSGCATYQPVAPGYAGPTARIIDSSYQESGGKGRLFYVATVDGNAIANAAGGTAQSSYGRGFSLSLRTASRDVPIRKLRLKLVGTHVTAAPIHELASRAIGEFFRVEGEIDFLPVAGKVYELRGELTKAVASVWIADLYTGEPVTEKIVAK
ncbi:MAG: hypothetical protein ABL985_04710 [Casimicrobium sp.]